MNTTLAEAVALAQQLRSLLSGIDGVTRVVCPPFVSLARVAELLSGSGIAVGAQNLHPEAKGAFTGEVSGAMLQGVCQYVIVGHSERRQLFGEADDLVQRKVAAALGFGLTPILCVGETMQQRDAGQAHGVVTGQLRGCLAGLEPRTMAGVVVAYEPVWAIGTGRAATAALAQEMMGLMRATLSEIAGKEAASGIPLLYGGSVTAENIGGYAGQQDVDGALVGGASLRAEEFARIAQAVAAARGAK
jgi:triosephosphate isomerase